MVLAAKGIPGCTAYGLAPSLRYTLNPVSFVELSVQFTRIFPPVSLTFTEAGGLIGAQVGVGVGVALATTCTELSEQWITPSVSLTWDVTVVLPDAWPVAVEVYGDDASTARLKLTIPAGAEENSTSSTVHVPPVMLGLAWNAVVPPTCIEAGAAGTRLTVQLHAAGVGVRVGVFVGPGVGVRVGVFVGPTGVGVGVTHETAVVSDPLVTPLIMHRPVIVAFPPATHDTVLL